MPGGFLVLAWLFYWRSFAVFLGFCGGGVGLICGELVGVFRGLGGAWFCGGLTELFLFPYNRLHEYTEKTYSQAN